MIDSIRNSSVAKILKGSTFSVKDSTLFIQGKTVKETQNISDFSEEIAAQLWMSQKNPEIKYLWVGFANVVMSHLDIENTCKSNFRYYLKNQGF